MKPAQNTSSKSTAQQFLKRLKEKSIGAHQDNAKFFKESGEANRFLGIRMSDIFALAKEFTWMPLNEVESLLNSECYEARMGAVSIMDFQARDKKISPVQRKALYDLYIKRHDRINNWDLVDRSAPYVIGGYLFDKPREPLYKLAKSKNIWERRTAIVSTYYFIRQNDLDDTFRIAEILLHDKDDLINKAVGSWIREAGKKDNERLLGFLDEYSASMPRVTLRYAIEKLTARQKKNYLANKQAGLGANK